jgi:hypothetical protein
VKRGLTLLAAAVALHAAPASASTPFCPHPIARATWVDEPQGARIMIFPSGCGRRTAWLAPRSAFRDALAAGGRDAVNRAALYQQFRCHTLFAPAKPSWNLESWRPHVSQRRLIESLCNPRGAPTRRRPHRHRPGLFAAILQAAVP